MCHLRSFALLLLLTSGCESSNEEVPSAREAPAAANPVASAAPSAEPTRAQEPAAHPVLSAAPSAAPTIEAAPSAVVGGLSVTRFELAQGVEAREPVAPGTAFIEGTKVYAFLELNNKEGEPTALLVHFERDGAPRAKGLRLDVPRMERYRTHAFTPNTSKPGRYRCVVTTQDGSVVVQKEFDVIAPT